MSYLGNSPGVASQRVVSSFTPTSGQTTFIPLSGYTLGYVDVFLNGIRLVSGDDYTANNGTTVILVEAATNTDTVEIVSYIPRALTDGYTKPEADAKYIQLTTSYSGDVTGTYNALTLANSGVTAGSYGSATNIPAITVDSKGRLTSVTNTAVSIPSGSLTFTGDVTGSGSTGSSTSLTLANSGVTAGSYGSASAIPQITVDAKGRITTISTNAVSIPSGSISVTGGDITMSGNTGTAITNATIANGAVTAAKLADGAVTSAKLDTNITIGGTLTVTGNLTVSGTTTTVNSTTLEVADLNITLAKNAANAAAATGAGITVAGANATLLYNSGTNSWSFNKSLNITSNLDVDGDINIDGGDLTASGSSFNLINTNITTANLFGAATSVNIAANAATASNLVFGPFLSNNALTINAPANGTAYILSGVSSGTVGLFTNVDTGTINLANMMMAGGTINIGSINATIWIGNRILVNGSTVLPSVDNSYDLGSFTARWRNIYTADMHFSNEGSQNSVDGTWGNWTLQEGEQSIYMLNNRTGRKYKIVLEEV